MNILMLLDSLDIGGTETHVLSISKALIEKENNIFLVSKDGQLKNLFEKSGIRVNIINLNRNLEDIIIDLIKIVKLFNIDIVHCHLEKSMLLGTILYDKIKIPYIITLHGLFYSDNLLNETCYSASHIIAVSYCVKDEFSYKTNNKFKEKLSVIFNGVDLNKCKKVNDKLSIREKLNIPNKDIIITYCSRLSFSKGNLAENFLHQFYNVAKDNLSIHAIILGDGNKKRNLDFYSNNLNVKLNKKAIHMIGSVTNVFDYYKESKIVVGTGRVLIEALSMECNCIAYGLKGYMGIVEPKNYENMINSYFGDHKFYKNIPFTLFEDMSRLLNRNNRDIIDANNRWILENFYENKLIDRLVSIYRKTLESKK